MMTWSERLRSEGIQQGELVVLVRQLTRRFGPIDAATTDRLQLASTAELERWADNIQHSCQFGLAH